MNLYRYTFSWTNSFYLKRRQKQLAPYHLKETPHFYFYHSGAAEDLLLVQQEFANIYQPINNLYYFKPETKVPVIIYDTSALMNKALHWHSKAVPMGIYWLGQINILAPSAWISCSVAEQECIFRLLGPVAHEYTHYVIDHLTFGNYPRWLSEGLAQFTEQALAKLPPISPETLLCEDYYPLADLEDNFDFLPNQPLAYLESLLAGEILIEQFSFAFVRQLLRQLRDGKDFYKLMNASRLNYPTFNLLLQAKLADKRKIFLQSMTQVAELS